MRKSNFTLYEFNFLAFPQMGSPKRSMKKQAPYPLHSLYCGAQTYFEVKKTYPRVED
jgi:hypothetical protein